LAMPKSAIMPNDLALENIFFVSDITYPDSASSPPSEPVTITPENTPENEFLEPGEGEIFPQPQPEVTTPSQAHPHPIASLIWETIQTLVLAGLLIVFFRTFIFQNFVVEGSSMFPTLIQGDRLIVSRLSYVIGEPERGDIIVFQYPYGPEKDYVKRIIGLPGETVSIKNGTVIIDGKPLPAEDYVKNKSRETKAPVTLGDDEYFVMGDNRTGSSDSRSWGPLQRHFIIGKAWLIYYPFDHFQLLRHPEPDKKS